MSFVIEPITESDGEEWARVYYAAFKTVLGYLFVAEPTDESYKKWGVDNIKTIQGPDTYAFKSVDTSTGQIVGIASWEIFREPPSEEVLGAMLTEVGESAEVDSKRREGLLKDVVLSRKEIMSKEPSILLRILMVRPEYQRRGIGKSLMQWGLQQIDEQGIRGYLEASKKGKPMYEKLGFHVVREIVFEWEGEVLDINCTMIREPKSES